MKWVVAALAAATLLLAVAVTALAIQIRQGHSDDKGGFLPGQSNCDPFSTCSNDPYRNNDPYR
jgi:hypothetical protein